MNQSSERQTSSAPSISCRVCARSVRRIGACQTGVLRFVATWCDVPLYDKSCQKQKLSGASGAVVLLPSRVGVCTEGGCEAASRVSFGSGSEQGAILILSSFYVLRGVPRDGIRHCARNFLLEEDALRSFSLRFNVLLGLAGSTKRGQVDVYEVSLQADRGEHRALY